MQVNEKLHNLTNDIFNDLFVLEIANNHWGSVERGKNIIQEHGEIARRYGIKAAVKFQFRDVDTFIQKKFLPSDEIKREGEVVEAPGSSSRYIKKTIATKLTKSQFKELFEEAKKFGLLTMSTPFDESSVEWCNEFDLDIVKIASQDAKSWTLIERIVKLRRPTIISNGGTDISDLDKVVDLFEKEDVPLAINHCVSLYPSEDHELELNQIDYLKNRYPNHVIGFSTHEYHSWDASTLIAYAKGARTFERHVDIQDSEGTPVSKYCSLPKQVEIWFASFLKAKEMCGTASDAARMISEKEREYVKSVSRGVYALRDLPKGYELSASGLGKDFEFAIPFQKGQLSAQDLNRPIVLDSEIKTGEAVFVSN